MFTFRIAAMSVLICAGCDGPDHANAATPCDPAVAAAAVFLDAPADVPAEHARATCDLASGPRKCTVSGDKETCCGPAYCCTNNSAGNTYVCRRIIGQADL